MIHEECSNRPARPSHFRPAPAPNHQRGRRTLRATHAQLYRFGTGQRLELCHRSPTDPQKLEISLTLLLSSTSIFLIDKFLPISRLCSSLANFHSPSLTGAGRALSNRDTKKLEFPLTRRKQRTGHFLIATFRAFSYPAARSASMRNLLASPCVLNLARGGCNLPCRP